MALQEHLIWTWPTSAE